VNHRKTRTSTTFRRETPFAQQQIRAPLTPRELRVNKKGRMEKKKLRKKGKVGKVGREKNREGLLSGFFEL
jgi:hypothetical protein